MSLDTALARWRSREQTQFRSTCTVTRASGGPRTFDPVANDYADPAPTTVYDGPCKVRRSATAGIDTEVAGREVRLQDLEVILPADTAVAEGDTVTVSSSPDPALAGKTLRITDVLSDDWQINRVVAVEEVA